MNDKEEILKKLLKNILDVKLSHLEKRTQDQIKDLKYTIDISKKQQLLLTKISLIKIEPKKPRNNNHNREIRTRDRSRDITPLNIRTNRRNSIKKEIKNIKSKTPDAGIRKRRIERNIKETTINIKTDLRPVKKIIPKNNNKIPSYMMPTSSNANKNRRNNDKSVDRNSGRNKRERRALTADDRVKNKKSIKKKNKVNLKIENNLKIDDIKIEDMKIHIPIEEKKEEKIEEIKIKEDPKKFFDFTQLINEKKVITKISSLLDTKTQFNFFTCNKKLSSYSIDKLNNYLSVLEANNGINEKLTIQDSIASLKTKYPSYQFSTEPPKFALSRSTITAIELLNNEEYNKIFHNKDLKPPLDNILFIYRIFFRFLKDNDIKNIEDEKLFWMEASEYILNHNEGKTGDFFKNSVENFDFDVKNLYEIKKLLIGKEENLKPNYFRNIEGTTGLIFFVIKDALEYSGVILSMKKNVPFFCLKYLEYVEELHSNLIGYIENRKILSNSD